MTPIQLSAERLWRKYLKEITTDPEIFATCTETIIRQVEDIGRMVDEFVVRAHTALAQPENRAKSAARLPNARATPKSNSSSIFRPATSVVVRQPPGQPRHRQLKNAAEAVDAVADENADAGGAPARRAGWVRLKLAPGDEGRGLATVVAIEDNGRGLPAEHRDRLTEPYVTTRTKGTGLGLAIVKKIMEDHNGELLLDDRDGGGARVSLVFKGKSGDTKDAAALTAAARA